MEVDSIRRETLQETLMPHRRGEGGAGMGDRNSVEGGTTPERGGNGGAHQSCLLTGKIRRAWNVEAPRRGHVRKALSPPGRGHAPGQPLGYASRHRKEGEVNQQIGSNAEPRLRNRW